MTIERLRDVLNAIGPPVTTIQLAEMIWLACQLPAGDQEPEPASDAADTEMAEAAEADPRSAVNGEDLTRVAGSAAAPEKRQALHALSASGEGAGTDADTLLVPTAPMLRHPLAIQRALRPLKRRVPSRLHRVLDEAATAARAADRPQERPWIPVMVPARERWLSLALVIDTGPAMYVWQPLASELREAMFRLGAFRDVRVWLLADLADRVGIRASPRGPALDPAALIDPTGRQAVVLFSDCSGQHWWEGRTGPAVHLWARRGPTAILQPLTEGLWRRTAAPTVPGQAVLARPGAPNTTLKFTPHDAPTRQRAGTLPVPVIELSADWLADWAKLVTASGGGARDTAVTYLTDRVLLADEPLVAEREFTVTERVLRFQGASSPEAAELAAHIAVAVPSLPVMQLIQRRIMPGSRPGDLAEVLLSGLLRPVDAVPGLYDFIPGARAALLRTLPRPESLATAEVLEQISAEIQARAGTAAKTFQAIMPVAQGTGSRSLGPDERPFALVSTEALSLLHHTAIPVRFSQADAAPRNPRGEEISDADDEAVLDKATEPVITATDVSPSPLPASSGESRQLYQDIPLAKISLLGPVGSGKTTYLAALGQAVTRADRSNGEWNIFPVNAASERQLVEWSKRLVHDQKFPDRTDIAEIIPLQWEFVGNLTGSRYEQRRLWRRRKPGQSESRFLLNLVDVSGQAYGYVPESMNISPDIRQGALDHLAEADGLIYLFDPITEREYRSASMYIDAAIAPLSRYQMDQLVDGYLPQQVSVCVTKFDHPDLFFQARRSGLVNYGADGMPRVLDEHAEAFFDSLCEGDFWGEQGGERQESAMLVRDLLKSYFHPERIKYFVSSSIGYWRPAGWNPGSPSLPGFTFDPDDFRNILTGHDGTPRIRGVIHPINVLEPLISLQQRLAKRT